MRQAVSDERRSRGGPERSKQKVNDESAAVDTWIETPNDVVRCRARSRRGMALERPRR